MTKKITMNREFKNELLEEYYRMSEELESLRGVGDNRLTSKRYALVDAQRIKLRIELERLGITP